MNDALDPAPDRRGSTLILVIVMGTLLGFLAFSLAAVTAAGGKAETHRRESSDLRYRCEAVAELLRLEVVHHLESSGQPVGYWLGQLRGDWTAPPGTSGVPGSPSMGPRPYQSFADVHAWIDRVAEPGEGFWVEVVGATLPTVGEGPGDTRAAQSVRLRVNVGQSSIFDLAMLTETTNCMFCHLRVNGDVGSIAFFRPGWGKENQAGHPDLPDYSDGSRGSGAGSSIVGNVYVGTMGTKHWYGGRTHVLTGASDDTDSDWRDNQHAGEGTVNGTQVLDPAGYDPADPSTHRPGDLFEDYTGPRLPADTIGGDGVSDFPSFDPADAERRARAGGGSIWAGSERNTAADGSGTWVVPLGGDWATSKVAPNDRSTFAATNGAVIDGNLVLVGTPDNPIRLDGDVFVKGDVILRGTVEGQGAIYSGRNIYIVGDVKYKNTPQTWPLQNDGDAVAAVQQGGADELRLAARSNIVIGDWTYEGADGQVERLRDRQGQDFMTVQFSLNDVVRHYAQDANGVSHELTYDAGSDRYLDDRGNVVPKDQVHTVDSTQEKSWRDKGYMGVNAERYDAVMAPGVVAGDDAFDPWMTQGEFKQLLGQQDYPGMTWRMPGIPARDSEQVAYEYGPGWAGSDAGGQKYPGPGAGVNRFDQDALGPGQGMYVSAQHPSGDGSATARVMETGRVRWDTQVTHIDAFLYANKRIAGKVDAGSLTVNGGMAARELGVLAPGVQSIITNGSGSRGSPSLQGDAIPGAVRGYFANPGTNAYGQSLRDTYLLYDFRLRNGGFGFNLISAAGDLIFYASEGAANPDPAVFELATE